MPFPADFDERAVRRALTADPAVAAAADAPFEAVPSRGVAHDHVALGGTGLLLRLPRADAPGELALEAAAFARAAPCGHTPALHAILAPALGLPYGALVVARIRGRTPRLPEDLPAIADALAALHRLELPEPEQRPPLPDQADPVAALLEIIEAQAKALPAAGLAAPARASLEAELGWARALARDPARPCPPQCLIAADTQPGNLVIDAAGKAWLVDLERAAYSAAAIDLAHATLPTSTGWDPDVATTLTRDAVLDFYRSYLAARGPEQARLVAPGLRVFRRLTWLRTVTRFLGWRSLGAAAWPGLPPRLANHYAAHVRQSLDQFGIEAVRAEWTSARRLDLDSLI